MATLVQAAKRAKRFNFEKLLLDVIKDNDNIIIDLNTESQLFQQGIDSQGLKLMPYRSEHYAALKATLNPNRVTDLKLEGDFHSGFKVDASRFPIFIDSVDVKTEMLIRKYGENIFGLTGESLAMFVDQVLQEIQVRLLRGVSGGSRVS